jgi:O-antigen ligase
MNGDSQDINRSGGGTDDNGPRKVRWRLVGALLATAALTTAAALLLPSGATRLLLMALLGLPVIFFFVSRPEYVLAIILFMRFTNFDIFLPMRLFRPLFVLLVISLIASWLDGRRLVFRDRFLPMLMLAFFLIAFHSMAFAEDLQVSMDAFEFLTGVFVIIAAVLLLTDSRKYFLAFLIVLTVATMVSNFLPFIIPPPGAFASKTLMWEEGVLRYEGYQFEANTFAFHQIFIIPILLFLLAKFDRPRYIRPLILAALGGTVFVLMLSFSRGGFVGLLVILAVLLVIERKNRAVMTIAAVGVAILTVAAPALYWDRINSLYEAAKYVSQDYAIMVRIQTLKVAVILGLKNPVFGVGIGNFIYQASRFLPFTKVVHNAFLQIFSELGLPGLLVVSTIFIRNIFIIRSMMRSDSKGERARLGRFLMVQQIAVVFNAMFIPIGHEIIFWLPLVIPSLADIAYSEKADETERL